MPNQPVMTVLIFEDPKATQKVPHPLLTEMGLRLLWSPVRSAQEALFALWQHKPSIVIVDAKLGDGSDGREIIDALVDAQALRATGNFGEPVVVAIDPQTSWAQSAHRGPNFESELRQALEMAKLLVPASPTEELVPAGEQSLAEVG